MATNDIMSNILDRILDSMGLDEDNRQRRMRCQKAKELLITWSDESIRQLSCIALYAGSNYETTTVDGLSSDIDILSVNTKSRVIQDIEQWIPDDDRQTYMIDETDCYKSYVKLYLLSPHYPGPVYKEMVLEMPTKYVADEKGKLFFSSGLLVEQHTCMSEEIFLESHGPALQVLFSDNTTVDGVLALQCDFFPHLALRWKERQTSETRQRVGESIITEADHCHVVPVGNKLSLNRSLEWRYSFTHIERKLVHVWNNTQYKLYTFMKFILKDLIEPYVPDVLSSYHIKTIMFWMNEEYPRDYFEKSNIIHCLLRYLTNLIDTVRRKSLPHYFIEECNLYYNKIDDRASRNLTNIIQQIINTFPRSLFHLERRNLGSMLHDVFTNIIPLELMCDQNESERLITSLQFDIIHELYETDVAMQDTMIDFGNKSIIDIQSALQRLKCSAHTEDIEIKNFITFCQENFLCDVSIEFIANKEILPTHLHTKSVISAVTNVQRYVNNCCINTRLKVAAFLVCTGDFHQGSVLLDRIERQIKPYTLVTCVHPSCERKQTTAHKTAVHDNKPTLREYAKHYIAGIVEYRSEMIGHLPRAFVYEMFRSTWISPQVKHNLDDFKWHQHVIINCQEFMFFLRHVIAKAKGLYAESIAAIDNLERISKQRDLKEQPHSETNHNVIGHCHMELGDTQRAYREYKKSLNVKKFDNAVIWHLAVLLRRQIRGDQ